MSERRIANLDALRSFAQEVSREPSARLLILLDGPMGAGKTQFTKFVLESLGSSETVSPSFAIHNSYETTRGVVHHLDLFRLENADDLESTGFWDLFEAAESWIIIEWAEKLEDFGLRDQLPKSWKQMRLRITVEPQTQERVVTRLF